MYEPIMNLGIGKKLLFAFGLSASAALLAGIVWWVSFQHASDNQQEIIQEAIPAMITAQLLAEVTGRIATTTNSLARAKIKKDRIDLLGNLESDKADLKIILTDLSRNDSNFATVVPLELLVEALLKNVNQQEQLVNMRFDLSRKRDVSSTELMNAAVDMGKLLSEENPAGFEKFLAGESAEWVEKDFWLKELGLSEMDRSTLKLEIVKLVGIINQLTRETDLIVMNYLQSEFTVNVVSIERKVKIIENDVTRNTAEEFMNLILQNSQTFNTENVFEINRSLLRLNLTLAKMQNENNDHVISVNSEVGRYISNKHENIDTRLLQSKDDIVFGRNIFLVVISTTILSVALILWFYVFTAVRRLKVLEEGMTELAKGNYEIDLNIDPREHDELALMADAVLVFQEKVIEKDQLQRRQVEIETSLRMHKDSLETLVDERTEQILEANRELAQQAVEHVEARELAESASRVKTDFLATMSHELRTPMSGLLGVINLIKDTEVSKLQGDYLNTLEVISNTLLEILNDILGYSQIEAGKLVVSNADFDIHFVIGDMITVLRPVADKKYLYLMADISPSVPRVLYGDAGKIRQILLNIMGNGIKFTNKGSVKLNVIRQPSAHGSDIRLLFTIEDTGIGIPKHLHKNIFEAFNQGMVSTSQQYGGTGLGLTICKRLVTLLGGEIICSSTLGGGSVFSFEIPFKQNLLSLARADDDSTVAELYVKRTEKLNILVVEDDPIYRMVLRAYLEKEKHKVTEAGDGDEAVILVSNHDFDVVLMDLRMPKLNGIQASMMIRELPSPRSLVPIIAISAHTNPQKAEDVIGAGMNGFIAKPVNPMKLEEVVQQVVFQQVEFVFAQPTVLQGTYPHGWDCYDLLLQDAEFIGIEKTKIKTDLFLKTAGETLEAVNKAVASGDRDTVRESMHKLKGAASAVGLYPLSDSASALEALARDETEDLGRKLGKFKILYDLSCNLLVRSLEKVQSKLLSN